MKMEKGRRVLPATRAAAALIVAALVLPLPRGGLGRAHDAPQPQVARARCARAPPPPAQSPLVTRALPHALGPARCWTGVQRP